MAYVANDDEIAMLENPRYQTHVVDAKTGPDRFRSGYKEACIAGFKFSEIEDVRDDLRSMGYDEADMDFDFRGFNYTSPDRKTEIFIDGVMGTRDRITRVIIFKGRLSEAELPQASIEVISLFNSIYGRGVLLNNNSYYTDALKDQNMTFGGGFDNRYEDHINPSVRLEGQARRTSGPRMPANKPFTDDINDIYKQMERDMQMPDMTPPAFNPEDPIEKSMKEMEKGMEFPNFDIPDEYPDAF